MILLCNGDSWTQGDSPSQTLNWEATKTLDWYDVIPEFGRLNSQEDKSKWYKFYDSSVWPKVLGEKLGWETWNCGKLGISNDRIFRTTINSIEYLESLGKKDIFVVISFTSLIRYESFQPYEGPNSIHECHRLEHKETCSKEVFNVLIQKMVMLIINFQNYLKMKNIPYLFFNAFDDMDEDLKTSGLYKYIDLENIYNNNLTSHFKTYIEDNYNADWEINDDYFIQHHPTDKSHILWGNQLYKYMVDNIL